MSGFIFSPSRPYLLISLGLSAGFIGAFGFCSTFGFFKVVLGFGVVAAKNY